MYVYTYISRLSHLSVPIPHKSINSKATSKQHIYISISIHPHTHIYPSIYIYIYIVIVIVASAVVGCHRAATTTDKGNKTATPTRTARTHGSRATHRSIASTSTPTSTPTLATGRRSNDTATATTTRATATHTSRGQRRHRQCVRQDNADMWSTLLVPLLLLHLVQLHSTLAMATASGGLTVLEGSSTSSSSSSSGSGSGSSSSSGSGSSSVSSTSSTGNMLVSSPASTSASASASSTSSTSSSKRHRKRDSNSYDYHNYSENNTALEWLNPCGGSYSGATERRRQRPKQVSSDLLPLASAATHTLSPLFPLLLGRFSLADLQPVEARRRH